MKAISAHQLCKAYGPTHALEHIDFDVEKGEIFGIIGPDGAGKTTLFRILTTLMLPDKGTASIEGLDIRRDFKKIRRLIGYMPGRFSLYQDLTVEENLNFFATLFGTTVEENYHLIEDIYRQIEPFRHRRAGKLSGGMKQKLALSCALIHKPEVLFLDEPTTGVDPVSRKEFWEMLVRLRAQGISILVSTPYMDEAKLCDRIALIQNGRFLRIDTPEGIVATFPYPLWAVQAKEMHRLLTDLKEYPPTRSSYSFGNSFHVVLEPGTSPDRLKEHLHRQEHKDIAIKGIRPTVEDCFMLMLNEKENL